MSTVFHHKLGSSATAATITLASLGSSTTVGQQSDAITIIDGSNRVPEYIDIDFWAKVTTGSLANDKSVTLWVARSVDGTSYEAGPPAVGASNTGFTFASAPVGSSALPTGLLLVGGITFNAQSEAHRKMFRLWAPPAKLVFVVLNSSGIALTGTAGDHGIQYRTRQGEGV